MFYLVLTLETKNLDRQFYCLNIKAKLDDLCILTEFNKNGNDFS